MPIRNLVVTVYTRHSAQCSKKNDQYRKRCNCPKWLYINNNGKRSQRSAKTRAWDRAEETRRAVERDFEDAEQRKRPGAEPEKEVPTSLEDAVSRFLAAKEQENLSPSTVSKLTTIFARQLLSWATENNIKTLQRIGGEELEAFRATWKPFLFYLVSPSTRWKALSDRNLSGRSHAQS